MDYKISVEETGEVERNITIEIPRAVYNQQFDQKVKQTASEVRLKGFRPGRAPKAMVVKLYGDSIRSDVVSNLINDAYRNALVEHKLQVVGNPEINIDDEDAEKDLTVTAGVSIYPNPEIADYKGLSFEVKMLQFEEEKYQERIDNLREQQSSTEELPDKKVAEDGDLALVDYQATVDGEGFAGSDGSDTYIELGSNKSLDGIEEAVIGQEVGSKKEVEVTLPEQAGEELAGKTAVYTLSLKSLHKKTLPELNDEFAKNTGLAEDLPGLEKHIRELLEEEIERTNKGAKERALFDTLIEQNTFEVPQAMVDEEVRTMMFEMNFLDPRKEESYRVDVSHFREGFGKEAEFRVRRAVILGKVVESEGKDYEDSDVDSWLDEVATREGQERDRINQLYGFPDNLSRLKDILAREKTVELLLDSASITEKESSDTE